VMTERRRLWIRRSALLLALLVVFWLVAVLLLHAGSGTPSFGAERGSAHSVSGSRPQCTKRHRCTRRQAQRARALLFSGTGRAGFAGASARSTAHAARTSEDHTAVKQYHSRCPSETLRYTFSDSLFGRAWDMQVRAFWCWNGRRVSRVSFGSPDGDHFLAGEILQVSVPRVVAFEHHYILYNGYRSYLYRLRGHIEQCLPILSLIAPACVGMTKNLEIRLYQGGFVRLVGD